MKEGELGKFYSDGEVIFSQGDKGDAMYVIQTGKVRISTGSADKQVTIATLEAGEIFGEMALFDKLPRSATVTASGEARILTIDKKKLFATISRDPTLAFKVIQSMSQRIRKLNDELTKLKENKTAMGRVCMNVDETCKLILDEARNLVSADNGSLMLLDEKEGCLRNVSAFGNEFSPKVKIAVGEGIAGDVMKTGRAELVNNVKMDYRFKAGATDIQSMICVPLKCSGNTFGVINMSISSDDRIFSLDDLKLLRSLALHASVAIEHGKNFAALTEATDEVLRHASLLDVY